MDGHTAGALLHSGDGDALVLAHCGSDNAVVRGDGENSILRNSLRIENDAAAHFHRGSVGVKSLGGEGNALGGFGYADLDLYRQIGIAFTAQHQIQGILSGSGALEDHPVLREVVGSVKGDLIFGGAHSHRSFQGLGFAVGDIKAGEQDCGLIAGLQFQIARGKGGRAEVFPLGVEGTFQGIFRLDGPGVDQGHAGLHVPGCDLDLIALGEAGAVHRKLHRHNGMSAFHSCEGDGIVGIVGGHQLPVGGNHIDFTALRQLIEMEDTAFPRSPVAHRTEGHPFFIHQIHGSDCIAVHKDSTASQQYCGKQSGCQGGYDLFHVHLAPLCILSGKQSCFPGLRFLAPLYTKQRRITREICGKMRRCWFTDFPPAPKPPQAPGIPRTCG